MAKKIVNCDNENELTDAAWEIIKNSPSLMTNSTGGIELKTLLQRLAESFEFDGEEVSKMITSLNEQGKVRFYFTSGTTYSDRTKIPLEIFSIYPVIEKGDENKE